MHYTSCGCEPTLGVEIGVLFLLKSQKSLTKKTSVCRAVLRIREILIRIRIRGSLTLDNGS